MLSSDNVLLLFLITKPTNNYHLNVACMTSTTGFVPPLCPHVIIPSQTPEFQQRRKMGRNKNNSG